MYVSETYTYKRCADILIKQVSQRVLKIITTTTTTTTITTTITITK
jgi:hypothetical protein